MIISHYDAVVTGVIAGAPEQPGLLEIGMALAHRGGGFALDVAQAQHQ
jgi:hypothetical protein